METSEFCALTREAVAALLAGRGPTWSEPTGRRQRARWPFPGTVEMWVNDGEDLDDLRLATCLNLSEDGIGVRSDEDLPVGFEMPIAVHQPEVSFHGRGVVRHCTPLDEGYYIGLQFVFEDEP